MSRKAIVLYLHAHQPYRVRHYTIFDSGGQHDYFEDAESSQTNNQSILHKVSKKSYIPTNKMLLKILEAHPEFKLSLSITGTLIEQLAAWDPRALKSFQDLVQTGRV